MKLENSISVIKKLQKKLEDLIDQTPINPDKIIGVGINMPGLVDSVNGINYTFFDFEQPVRDIFAESLNIPVFIENDAKARALAEHKYGEANGKKNVLVLHLDWGVGLGMILNGKLYKGNSGFSGEFSHIPLIDDGLLCTCGKKGCLETIASATALARLAKEGLIKGNESILKNLINEDLDKLESKLIIEAARKGDHFAIDLLSQVGNDLGRGLATLIQLLNPEMIIIGGCLAAAKEYLLTSVHQSLYKYCIPKLREDTQIVYSKLGEDGGVLGALAVVMENIFDQ